MPVLSLSLARVFNYTHRVMLQIVFASLTENSIDIIYDCKMFIVQAIVACLNALFSTVKESTLVALKHLSEQHLHRQQFDLCRR
jgi:hypothetical protein